MYIRMLYAYFTICVCFLFSFAPWCPACQGFAPTWERFAGWSEGKEVRVAQVNVQEEMGLSGQFLISQLPTICQ